MGNWRCIARSHWVAPKPLMAFRPRVPWRRGSPELGSTGGSTNAAGLNAFPPGYAGPYRYCGIPGTTSGRICTRLPVRTEDVPTLRFTGKAECACTTLSTDQPPNNPVIQDPSFGTGMSYVTPVENECRR